MADRADALFQDWTEDEAGRRHESELAEAGEQERREYRTFRHDISAGDNWLEKVDQYARKSLADMKIPGHSMHDLEKGEAGEEQTAPPPPPIKKRRFTFGLAEKILLRTSVVSTIALLLPFFEPIQTISYRTSLLLPILAMILALRPLHMTSIGHECHQLILLISSWPFYVAYTLLILAISPRNITGYLILFSVGVMIAFSVQSFNASGMMTLLGPTITYSIIHMSLFQIYNMHDYEQPFKEAMIALGGATFGLAAAYFLHWLGAMTIFPWSTGSETRSALRNHYSLYASMLRNLRPVYDRIATHTLDPRGNLEQTLIEKELLDQLDEARLKELGSIPVMQKWVNSTLLETRFLFKGDGYRYLMRYESSLSLSRIARAAAGDVINSRADFEPSGDEEGPSEVLEYHRETFIKQDCIEDATINSQDAARKTLERENIPILMAKLSLLLELGGHRMAKLVGMKPSDKSMDEERQRTFGFLAREQDAMEKIAQDLEDLSISWMERYLRSHAGKAYDQSFEGSPDKHVFFKRTKLVSYVLILLKLVQEQKNVVKQLEKESTPDSSLAGKEWHLTYPFHDVIVPSSENTDRENFYKPWGSMVARWEYKIINFFSSDEWKLALKFALGTTLMILPGLLERSYQLYTVVQFLNGIFAFQVVLFKIQTGLVIERVIQRIVGVFVGCIVIGIAWELACINGCTDDNRKWILYGFEVVALFCYLWFKTKWPGWGYIGFSMMRTLASISTGFVTLSDPATNNIWREGGYVLASTAVGAGGALILATLVWPKNGRESIRLAISDAYHDFTLITEQILTNEYEHPEDITIGTSQLAAYEHRLAQLLYFKTGLLLRSIQLEDMQKINFDAPLPAYAKAVKSSQQVWLSLWKINHLGGVMIYSRDKDGQPAKTMDRTTASAFFAANRWLTTSFSAIAFQLNNRQRRSSPALRPIVASPRLLGAILHDFVSRAYRDELFLESVVSSRNLALMLNLPLLGDCLHEISRSLDGVYELMEAYLREPIYAAHLREAERVSYDLYKIV